MSVHIPKAKHLLLEVTTTTLSPSFWHYDVSARDWGKVSTARGLYYYIESQYLTHEVSTHHWGQVSTAKDLLLHWVPVSDTMMSVHMTEAKFLLPEVRTTTLSPSIWHMKQVHIPEAKFLLLKVSITTLCQNIWHMKSIHITETKVLLLEVSTTTLSPSIWHHIVSTHDWGKVSTAGGLYYYIVSK